MTTKVLTFDAHDVVSDLLGDDRIGYEFDEIVYGVYGRVHALETLDLLADGQRVVGERRVAVVIRRTAAVHCSVTLRTSLGAAYGRPKTSTTRKTDNNVWTADFRTAVRPSWAVRRRKTRKRHDIRSGRGNAI